MSSIEETPVTSVDDEGRRRAQRAEQVALWRYQLIRDAADPDLSTKQRGRLVRTLANTVHKGPFGVDVVTVGTYPAAALRPAGAGHPPGRAGTAGVRPVRSTPPK